MKTLEEGQRKVVQQEPVGWFDVYEGETYIQIKQEYVDATSVPPSLPLPASASVEATIRQCVEVCAGVDVAANKNTMHGQGEVFAAKQIKKAILSLSTPEGTKALGDFGVRLLHEYQKQRVEEGVLGYNEPDLLDIVQRVMKGE